jgi:predicted ribosomally synthesized peptide with SipW-like signal peptide
MKLTKLRTIALTGVLGVAGLGLIGAGGHAVFSASTTSNQTITAGTPGVTLSGSCYAGPCAGNPSDLYSLSPDGTTLSFTAGGPFGSSFTTGDELVTATNTGNIPLTELVFTLGNNYPLSQLATESQVCIGSTGLGTSGSFFQIYNGPLSGVPAGGWGQQGDTLTIAGSTPTSNSGPTDNYIVNVYAGPNEPTACGTSGLSTPTLNTDAEGQSIVVSATMTYQG